MRHWKKKPWVDSEVRNWDYIADHLAPDATSADAGKVLTVGESGKPEWGEAGGSGGGGVYTIHPSFIEGSLVLDKTFNEIFAMMRAGMIVNIVDVLEYPGQDPAFGVYSIVINATKVNASRYEIITMSGYSGDETPSLGSYVAVSADGYPSVVMG